MVLKRNASGIMIRIAAKVVSIGEGEVVKAPQGSTSDFYNKSIIFSEHGCVHKNLVIGDAAKHGDIIDYIDIFTQPAFEHPLLKDHKIKAPTSGDWWLFIEKEVIGYWLKELFTHLAHDASMVRFGGIAGEVSGEPSPPMGNGHSPAKHYDLTRGGYIRETMVFNEKGVPVYFDFSKTLKKQDTTKDCYDLDYYSHKAWNHIMYGGPGGSRCA
ncbi:uncharacterized protein LOC113272217 [Papaver somniferum]|uniref:uncharacterized protein LOC113272217 n=1 Tax=Papaver somniferum TaxID=3469 RepID=UPI000E6F6EBD|nr:uncharacterized protein LOC113272217 [Papaver somniferum]